MNQFNKIMVGLDLSKMDDSLMSNLKFLISILAIKKIYFIHVSKNLILPEEVSSAYPDLMAPVDETIEKEIGHEIDTVGLREVVQCEIIVKEGNPQETMLRWCKVKDIDLLVMGRKKELKGSGSLVKNLSQKYSNPIFLIPEQHPLSSIKKILVPIDFSDYSKLTIELAEKIAENSGGEVQGCHLYEVPRGYSKTGKSFQEFAGIMLENAEKDFAKFVKVNKFHGLGCEFIHKNNKDEAENILAYAQKDNVDLIIIGSRGRTPSSAILLGSVAEKLVEINTDLPMLVMKKKGENMGFIETLFKL